MRLDTIGAGRFFGEIALLTGEPRTADVVAGADGTTVLRLPRASVSPILMAQPRFRDRFSAIANERRDALELPTRVEIQTLKNELTEIPLSGYSGSMKQSAMTTMFHQTNAALDKAKKRSSVRMANEFS